MHGPRGATGGVSLIGSFMDGMKVCLHSRIAMRVLLEIASFQASNADDLYAQVRGIDWNDFVGPGHTLAVRASTQDNPGLRHSGFCALKVKDAIVDALRDKRGHRPDVNPHRPDLSVVLHVRGSDAGLFLDMAGEPLHRRGYRVAMVDAPLKESLAAAVLSLGGVATDRPFVDPMAGSGTLAIEHALVARRIAPGLRRRMSFERWISSEHRRIWESLLKEARAQALPAAPCPILARDINPKAIAQARQNAEAAGVEPDIHFEVADVAGLLAQGPAGSICTNPPYGERLGGSASGPEVDRLYASIAQAFDRMPGWKAVCLSGNPSFSKQLHRRPTISHRLWNGAIEARLLVFEL